MKFLISVGITMCVIANAHPAAAQNLNQTIRGTIIDHDSQAPLIGATVVVLGSEPLLGAISDVDGNFRIANVPIGRVTLRVTYMGYEDAILANLLLTAAKEEVLTIAMTESVNALETITISAEDQKGEPLNEMSLLSTHNFSVEETQRYAGSFDDPARLVSGYAGVVGNPSGNNDIIVRGNTPKGILWRLEGIAIPNPNHFAGEGSTGGPINALSSKMLTNSDFLTGAFSPEYGDVTSGVFDMKMKRGNNEQREYTASISTLGADLTAEGPFRKGDRSSYIVNYRYSALDLLDRAGIVDFGGVPRYQDVSFKLQFPVGQSHHFSLFGVGGISGIDAEDTDPNDNKFIVGRFHGRFDLGVVGLNHIWQINDDMYVRTALATTTTGNRFSYAIPDEGQSFYEIEVGEIRKSNLVGTAVYNYKVNAKNKMETGVIVTRMNFDMYASEWDFDADELVNHLSDDGSADMMQAFVAWKHRFNDAVTWVNGLHYLRFALNGNYSVEPRSALKWQLSEKHSLNAGVGLHSKLEPVSTYLAKIDDGSGQGLSVPNRGLDIAKALHLVMGYDRRLGSNTHLKVEAYYQRLFDVPVEDWAHSTFSVLNQLEGYTARRLANAGKGRNYGVEFTAERYLHQGLYYMGTLSLFRSLYTPRDGVERRSAFDSNCVANFIGGKEFSLGDPGKNKVLFLNTRISFIGGVWYSPIDLAASIEKGTAVIDETNPFSTKGDDIFRADFSIGVRRNRPRVTTEWKLDIQNVFNHQAVLGESYIHASQSIFRDTQLGILPNITYKVSF